MDSGPSTPRAFTGTTDLGEHFAILYTSHGVKWLWGDAAAPYIAEPAQRSPSDGARSSWDGSTADGESIAKGLDAAAGVVGAASRLVEAIAAVGTWWETRQYRIMDQARFEEDRRIPWTADMLVRWVTAHEDRQHLDLRISAYLAREAVATMNALLETKKMSVPQSMLYDLELIREVLAASRLLFLTQFERLTTEADPSVAAAIQQAVPNSRLDMSFIRRLGEDPAEEWSRKLRDRASRTFDEDLRDAARHQDIFLQRLFPTNQPDTGDSGDRQGPLRKLANRVTLIPAIPAAVSDLLKEGTGGRRDDFRELALLAAEVTRATALHSAWGVVDSIVRQELGTGILITERDGQIELSAGEVKNGLRPLGRGRMLELRVGSSAGGDSE